METVAIILAVVVLAVIAGLIVKRVKDKHAEPTADIEEVETLEEDPDEEPVTAVQDEPSDHLSPAPAEKSDLERANEAAAKAKENTVPAPGGGATTNIPAPPLNNSYYGNQPRVPVVRDNDVSNAAFLALIAAQEQEALDKAHYEANGGVVEEPLSPEDQELLEGHFARLQAEIAADEHKNGTEEDHTPEAGDEGTVADDGKWVPVTETQAPERNDFSYDSSDNASTYNSATDNGTDTGSGTGHSSDTSSSSTSSGYDSSSWSDYGSSSSSSSSSSYDSGSSSSSYDSGSSSSFDSGSSGSFD